MSHIDESTHIEMANAIGALIDIIEAIQARSGHPLAYQEMTTIRQSKDLRVAAIQQLRAAGVLPPGGNEMNHPLKAEELPIGTVMVLGVRIKYRLIRHGGNDIYFGCTLDGETYIFDRDEIQELIDRGVRFELPKGGA
jgi:hypothetical protein